MGFFSNVGLEKVGQRKKRRYKKGVKSRKILEVLCFEGQCSDEGVGP